MVDDDKHATSHQGFITVKAKRNKRSMNLRSAVRRESERKYGAGCPIRPPGLGDSCI